MRHVLQGRLAATFVLAFGVATFTSACCRPAKKEAPAPEPAAELATESASPGWTNPKEACRYLDGFGFTTDAYQSYKYSPEEYLCLMDSRRVGGKPGEAQLGESSFAYMVTGGAKKAKQLTLELTIYDKGGDERLALKEFGAMMARLVQRAVHVQVPAAAVAALRAGESGEWDLPGGHKLELNRTSTQVGAFGPTFNVNLSLL
ncbi:MAG TPA: hypothetical protein VFS43_27830 [Polyangiaceae bacterium]|nr:hypothetical protein [Polyangiaceae bacterium]